MLFKQYFRSILANCKPAVWTPRAYGVTLTQLGRRRADDRPHVFHTLVDKHRIDNRDILFATPTVGPARHSDVATIRTAPVNDMSCDQSIGGGLQNFAQKSGRLASTSVVEVAAFLEESVPPTAKSYISITTCSPDSATCRSYFALGEVSCTLFVM